VSADGKEALQAKPVVTVATLRDATGLTTPTINSSLRELESRGIVKESTGRARDRVYVYRRYLEALAAEEEAPVGASEGNSRFLSPRAEDGQFLTPVRQRKRTSSL